MEKLKKVFKKIARTGLDCLLLLYGFAYYLFNQSKPLNQRTPGNAYLSMVRLFCLSRGWSNDVLSGCISLFDKPIALPHQSGILGSLSKEQVKSITQSLDNEGYYIFENKLPAQEIQKLYDFASKTPCMPRALDSAMNATNHKTLYDRNNLKSTVYDLDHQACLSNPDIQKLLHDHSLLAVAQSYLRTSPKIEPIAFWWSTPFSGVAQSNSAQLFHFDLDRIKWIKFFIFLTDVTIETGPHVFIRQSHRRGKIPTKLLQAGYARHEDKDVFSCYPKEDVKVFTVPAGTILAEDTRGLHKGTNLLKDERLVLELQFSNSLFGAVSPNIQDAVIEDIDLLDFAAKHPRIFKLFPI